MPPYTLRKELQLRYNVDRRLIYDWFRNKGLRAKEDRGSATSSGRADRHWHYQAQHRQVVHLLLYSVRKVNPHFVAKHTSCYFFW
ncbi:hypothetical protein NEOLEDRAFT_1088397 [Neolentinus lepideus HHB14362 ss-1]|uniref:Uncharacterized protein n=1 Tax=Neolentinus lepideus HHB14362 ss-1 TaxID=1314782 RepID=A0A165U2E2_9AGAM|nr:hypothetical protein NEOLEDRAFT_1088397 [Neolentinus lepideus HHB14362 ss-1]